MFFVKKKTEEINQKQNQFYSLEKKKAKKLSSDHLLIYFLHQSLDRFDSGSFDPLNSIHFNLEFTHLDTFV